jgi:hypothetical protein
MKIKSVVIVVGLLAFTRLASFGGTVEVAGNLPANGAGVAVNKTSWLAESFTVPTAQRIYQVSDIEVGLQRIGHPATSYYAFRIYTNVANKPGRLVGGYYVPTFTVPAFLSTATNFSGLFDLVSGPEYSLVGGDTYWVVAYSINTSTTAYINWLTSTSPQDPLSLTGALIGSSVTAVPNPVLQSADEGKTWTAFGGGIPALQVNVVTL